MQKTPQQMRVLFEALTDTSDRPTTRTLVRFLQENTDDIKPLRKGLQHTRSWTDPWYREVWRWIGEPEDHIKSRLLTFSDEKALQAEEAREGLRTIVDEHLVLYIPHSPDGADYAAASTAHLHDLVSAHANHRAETSVEQFSPGATTGQLRITLPDFGISEVRTVPLEFSPPDGLPIPTRPQTPPPFRDKEHVRVEVLKALNRSSRNSLPKADIASLLAAAYFLTAWADPETVRLVQIWSHSESRGDERARIDRATAQSQALVRKASQAANQLPPYSWDWIEIYRDLTDADIALVDRWAVAYRREAPQSVPGDVISAQMLSARMAERVAMEFYSKTLSQSVVDLAIGALGNETNDWKSADIMVAGSYHVDVKNARSNVRNKNYYSKHCVPNFKRNRRGDDVRIAGVFSPYLRLDEMQQCLHSPRETNRVVYLGETSFADILDLSARHVDPRFAIEILSTREIHSRGSSTIPHWVFDFPSDFYSERNRVLRDLRAALIEWLPPASVFDAGRTLPVFLAAQVDLPYDWQAELKPWERELYTLIKAELRRGPSLPRVLLCILRHFASMARCPRESEGYTPSDYARTLGLDLWPTAPLLVCDPLGTLNHWVDALDDLWAARPAWGSPWGLDQYQCFKLQGSGILRGYSSLRQRWESLVAYCGGKDEKGPCGHSPLIAGKETHCPRGFLRCSCRDCGYCCDRCRDERRWESDYDDERWQSTAAYFELGSFQA